MKIGIYDPYLDSLGGGERYVLTLAEFLSRQDEVEIFWDDQKIGGLAEKRFGIKMDKIKFVENIFTPQKSLPQKIKSSRKYDLIFFLSDGSIPTIFSKRGILHFQVPFAHVSGKTLTNRLKLKRFQQVVCNSHFTKKFIDKNYGVNSLVVYPPVDTENFRPLRKKNLILSVGRFTKTLHAKKQEVMINVFRNLSLEINDWELVLAGGAMPEDKPYVTELKSSAGDAPIKILDNISFSEIKNLYGQAKIYWHAAGCGENENTHPEKMEHFGITTVEAMAAGCVPVVFSGGGQREIIKEGISGFLWDNEEKLKSQTRALIGDEEKMKNISLAAQKRSKDFSQGKFYETFEKIIHQ